MPTPYKLNSTLRLEAEILIQENKTLRLEAEQNKITIHKQSEAHHNNKEEIYRLQQLLQQRDESLNILRHALSIEA